MNIHRWRKLEVCTLAHDQYFLLVLQPVPLKHIKSFIFIGFSSENLTVV